DRGRRVQFFQGGLLALDRAHGAVYPVAIGRHLLSGSVPDSSRSRAKSTASAGAFARTYRVLGGMKVFGAPLGAHVSWHGRSVEVYRYGALVKYGGRVLVLPVGDLELRSRGWLPARGAPDAFPATMSAALE